VAHSTWSSSVIALGLGHESVETTQTYLQSHLELKEAALAKLKPYEREMAKRFRPTDSLLDIPDYAESQPFSPRAAFLR